MAQQRIVEIGLWVRQARAVRFQALEEKQERIVPAPFEFVTDSADLLQVAVRVGSGQPNRSNLRRYSASISRASPRDAASPLTLRKIVTFLGNEGTTSMVPFAHTFRSIRAAWPGCGPRPPVFELPHVFHRPKKG